MNGIDSIGINKTENYLQGMQLEIKDKLAASKQDGTVSNAFDSDVAATLSISSSGAAQMDRAGREAALKKSIVQLDGGYKKFNLSEDETCILKSFRLEEYYDIRSRMKDTDRTSYNDLLKAEQTADNDSDPSEKFKVYAKAYNWAYGDIFDRIHNENPEVDIYVRSSGTAENHDYHMRNNRKSIVISTDEIKLLQSKQDKDKEAQERLWNSILEKIHS